MPVGVLIGIKAGLPDEYLFLDDSRHSPISGKAPICK